MKSDGTFQLSKTIETAVCEGVDPVIQVEKDRIKIVVPGAGTWLYEKGEIKKIGKGKK